MSKALEIASVFWIVVGVLLVSWVIGLNVQNNIFCSQSVFGSCPSPREIGLVVFGIILILAAIFILAHERKVHRGSSTASKYEPAPQGTRAANTFLF